MSKKWWELPDGESRILSLYCRFDAAIHVRQELEASGIAILNDDIPGLLAEVTSLYPEAVVDLMAQSVMLAWAGKVDVPTEHLTTYSRRLDQYIEGESLSVAINDLHSNDLVLQKWLAFHAAR